MCVEGDDTTPRVACGEHMLVMTKKGSLCPVKALPLCSVQSSLQQWFCDHLTESKKSNLSPIATDKGSREFFSIELAKSSPE